MKQFNYNPILSGRIIKEKDEQFDKFFYQGHPLFLIPDFSQYPEDIWLSYMSFLEKDYSCEVYDQDGGEVQDIQIINPNTGLTKCTYTAYGVMIDEDDEPQDIDVEIEGYVMEVPPHTDFNESSFDEYVFVATKVFEQYKMSI
jgi:hypothetical protein